MMKLTRRTVLGSFGAGAIAGSMDVLAAAPAACEQSTSAAWARGIEGQRKADLGDGTFLNPIFAGDHPDPTILKDGDDYYMTFSSFDAYPGVVVWHSRGDLSRPIAKPARGPASPHGMALSDDFTRNKFGVQWYFYDPGPNEMERVRYQDGMLLLAAKGSEPRDASPLTFIIGDQSYRVTADIEIEPTLRAGLLLFYNKRLYCGLGFDREGFVMHRYGLERHMRFRDRHGDTPPSRLWLRVTNDRHIVTIHHSRDGREWTKFDVQMEVSGYHHNVAYDFLSLRPAVYAAGRGIVKLRDVRHEAL